MSSTAQPDRDRSRTSPPWSTDWVTIGAAVVCAMVTWVLTVRLADLQPTVRIGGETQVIGGGSVALAAALGALVGLVVLRLLESLLPRGLEVWSVLALVTTLVSLLGPLSATSPAARGALASLHGVVAAVVIAAAVTSRRRRRAAG